MHSSRRVLANNARRRSRLSIAFVSILLSTSLGCGSRETGTDAASHLVVERSERDGIPVVRNVSGSAWGARASLEEQVTIGETEAEDEAYMFGWVASVWATDESIVVLDPTIPMVRVYDMHGGHVADVGRGGQGPGEYERPNGVVVTDDGRLLVADGEGHRLLAYTLEGAHLETWTWRATGFSSGARMLLPATDDSVWIASFMVPEGKPFSSLVRGYRLLGPDGAGDFVGPPDPPGFDPVEIRVARRSGEVSYDWIVPFAPQPLASLDAKGAWYVGSGADYRFWIFDTDGPVRVVERYWQPVAVQPEEATAFLKRAERLVRRMSGNSEWRWNGPDVPDTKPAYTTIVPDHSGRIWLQRHGEGRRVDGCDLEQQLEDLGSPPCWTENRYWDVFQGDGTYLGHVVAPEGISESALYSSHIEDERVLLTRPDEFGNTQVVLYRLLVPEIVDRD